MGHLEFPQEASPPVYTASHLKPSRIEEHTLCLGKSIPLKARVPTCKPWTNSHRHGSCSSSNHFTRQRGRAVSPLPPCKVPRNASTILGRPSIFAEWPRAGAIMPFQSLAFSVLSWLRGSDGKKEALLCPSSGHFSGSFKTSKCTQ